MTSHTLAKLTEKGNKLNQKWPKIKLTWAGWSCLSSNPKSLSPWDVQVENKVGSYHATQARNSHPSFAKLQ